MKSLIGWEVIVTFRGEDRKSWPSINCKGLLGGNPTVGQSTCTSSRAPGLNSGLQGSVNVHRGALLLVPQ